MPHCPWKEPLGLCHPFTFNKFRQKPDFLDARCAEEEFNNACRESFSGRRGSANMYFSPFAVSSWNVLFSPSYGGGHIIIRGWNHFWTFFLNQWLGWLLIHLHISQKLFIPPVSPLFESNRAQRECSAEYPNGAYIRIINKLTVKM